MNPKRLLAGSVAVMLLASGASAIELNSSEALKYYGQGTQDFRVSPTGNALIDDGTLNITNDGEAVANFSGTGIDLYKPLSVRSSGPLSVANGIELTGTSSNTIESLSTFYLSTSSGSASDIVLDPTGQVGVDSNLETAGNISVGGNQLDLENGDIENAGDIQTGSVSDSDGDNEIDFNSNRLTGLKDPNNEQDAATQSYVNNNDDTKPGTDEFGNADDLDSSGSLQSNTVADNEIDDNTVDNSEIQNSNQFTFGGITNNGDLDMTDNDHSGDGDIVNVNEINLARITSNKGNRIEVVSGEGPLDLNSNEIAGLSDPTDPQDAATRSYVNDNDDFEADTNANTECSNSESIYLDGAGNCQDLSTNTGSYINGDLLTDSVDGSEIQAQTIAGDDLGGNDDTINLATNVDVDTIDFGEGRIISTQGSASGVEMDFEGSDNTLDFRDYQNDGDVWLQVQNDGPVVTPDTNLNLGGNNINNIGGLQNCGNNQFVDGNGNCETDDDRPGGNDFGNADDLDSSGSLQSNTVADNEISDNTVDNTEIQNDDQFTFGGITSNGNLDMKGNSIQNMNAFSTQQIDNIVPFSARGTGLNNDDNRFVRIGGSEVVSDSQRGLTLVVLSKSDYSVKSSQNYDTYGSSAASNNLASELEAMDNSEVGVLTSYDAWENSVTSQLDQAFRNVGLYKAAATVNSGSRRPYAAIFSGTGDSGGSRAQEVLLDDSGDQPHAQLRGLLIDGSFISKGTKQNNLIANQGNQVAIRALNSGEVEIPNGDLDLGGNDINNIGGLQSCGDNEFVDGNGDCTADSFKDGDTSDTNELQDLEDVRSRDNTLNGNINLNGNSINGINSLDGGGSIDISGNNLVMSAGGDVIGPGGDTQLEFESAGIEIQSNPSLVFGDGPPSSGLDMQGYNIQDSSGQLTIASGTGFTGNLDINGNNINNIGGLQNCGSDEFVNGNGDCTADSFQADNQGLPDVLNNDNTANNKQIRDFDQLVTGRGGRVATFNNPSGGSSEIRFRSGENSGSDYGYIKAIDDENNNGENFGLTLGTENDPASRSNDHITLRPAGDLYLRPGDAGSGKTTNFGNLDMDNNNINDIGGLQNCGNNQFVDGNGNCETDDDRPGGNDFGNADDLDSSGSLQTGTVADNEISDNTVDNSEIQNSDQFTFSDTSSGPMVQLRGGNSGYNGLDISMDDDDGNNDYGLRVRFEDGGIGSRDTGGDVAFAVQPNENSPRVGIDTNSPSDTLEVNGGVDVGSLEHGSTDLQGNGDIDFNSGGSITSVENINVDSINSNKGNDPVDMDQGIDMDGSNIIDDKDGNVSFGDSIKVYGNVWSNGADLAEVYRSSDSLEQGELVMIGRERDDAVERANESYVRPLGVVSTNPSHVMNIEEDGYPIALEGKAPVKVNMDNGEIRRGDRVASSSVPGEGMKCRLWKPTNESKTVREIMLHNQKCKTGTIGYALEPTDEQGEILVKLK